MFQRRFLLVMGMLLMTCFDRAEGAVAVDFTETFSANGGTDFDFEPFIDDTVGYNFAISAGQFGATLTDGARSYSTVETSGISSAIGTTVTVSSDFTLTDTTTSTTRLGFVLFGTSSLIEQPGPDPLSYSAYISEPGGFVDPSFVVSNRETGDFAESDPFTTFTGNALTVGTFNLRVDATILANALQVDYAITNLTNGGPAETGQVVLAITAAPEGDFFGFHVDRNSSGPDSTIAFDNFSVSTVTAIPEPSSIAVLAIGAGFAALRRCRRKVSPTK